MWVPVIAVNVSDRSIQNRVSLSSVYVSEVQVGGLERFCGSVGGGSQRGGSWDEPAAPEVMRRYWPCRTHFLAFRSNCRFAGPAEWD